MSTMDQNIEPMQVDIDNDLMNISERDFSVENPKLDLEAYSQNYKSQIKLQRLHFIGKHCPSIAIDALRLCVSALKKSYNVDLYKLVITDLKEALARNADSSVAPGQDPDTDETWIDQRIIQAVQKKEKLEQDLKTYKINSIKESIRRGHDDCGDHFVDMGDYTNALRCYSRTRDYCISAQHIVHMCLNVITCSIYMRNWGHVQTYVDKAEKIHDVFDHAPDVFGTNSERYGRKSESKVETLTDKQKKENNEAIAKVKCAGGLLELNAKRYKEVANIFLQISHEHLKYPEILSPTDVAQYGGICALATFDREELQRKVLQNNSFKQFLEHQPQLREILHKFYGSKYAKCFELLEHMKDNLLLDIFLSPHVEKLYTQIRNKALVQYFSPYMSANLVHMAEAFNTTVAALEDELAQLVLDGHIQARIDSRTKMLHARNIDHRYTTYEKALALGKDFERRVKALIIRSVVLKNQLQVKNPNARDEDNVRSYSDRSEMMRGKLM